MDQNYSLLANIYTAIGTIIATAIASHVEKFISIFHPFVHISRYSSAKCTLVAPSAAAVTT